MRWARAGLVAPSGLLLSAAPPTAKRSHRSSAGSACSDSDFKAFLSFLTLTTGVRILSPAGEEMGDELRARFLPRRGTRGEIMSAASSRSLCQRRRSVGEVSSSCLSGSVTPMRSCQASLPGVTVARCCWLCSDAVSAGSGPSFCRFSLLESAFFKAVVGSLADVLS